MLYPFGFPFVPPAPPTEQTYQRLGVALLDGILDSYSADEGSMDNCTAELTYPSEKQLKEAYAFQFIYNDEARSTALSAPCSITYDGSKYIVSFSGYGFKTLIDPTKLSTCAHILYFKKGVLK